MPHTRAASALVVDPDYESIAWEIGLTRLINKPIEPQFQHQERPELVRIVALAAHMQLDQLSYRFRFEQPAAQRFVRKNHFTQKRLHLSAEPVTNRHAETHLASIQILARQQ